jgi:hypothetical protein
MEQQLVPLDPGSNGGRAALTPHSLELLRALNPAGEVMGTAQAGDLLAALTSTSCGGPDRPGGEQYEQLLRCLHSTEAADLDQPLPAGTPIRVMLEGCKPRPDTPFSHGLIAGLKPSGALMDLTLHGEVRTLEHEAHQVAQAVISGGPAQVAAWNKCMEEQGLPNLT